MFKALWRWLFGQHSARVAQPKLVEIDPPSFVPLTPDQFAHMVLSELHLHAQGCRQGSPLTYLMSGGELKQGISPDLLMKAMKELEGDYGVTVLDVNGPEVSAKKA